MLVVISGPDVPDVECYTCSLYITKYHIRYLVHLNSSYRQTKDKRLNVVVMNSMDFISIFNCICCIVDQTSSLYSCAGSRLSCYFLIICVALFSSSLYRFHIFSLRYKKCFFCQISAWSKIRATATGDSGGRISDRGGPATQSVLTYAPTRLYHVART